MTDWTPEQIDRCVDSLDRRWFAGPADRESLTWIVRTVLSAVDLSDHDRAVAADALRQAADDLIEAFPQTFRGEDGYLSARMYSSGEYAEWLRARAEGQVPDGD